MTDEIYINYGGEWLDVDDSTFGGFDTSTLWDFKDPATRGKARSMDLSVPATVKNTKIFNYFKLLPGEGIRRGINGAVTAGGKVINGVIFVTKYAGGRYSLMIAYGRNFEGFEPNNSAFTDTLTYANTDVPAINGSIPNWGWYEYKNGLSPHAAVGTADGLKANMFPSTNIKHIIDVLSASAGYAVSYPDPLIGRQYQADAYGLILPNYGVRKMTYDIHIVGSAYGGYNCSVSGGGTLADAGLEFFDTYYQRGDRYQDVKVHIFKAKRMVRVTLPDNSGVVVTSGEPYHPFNDWEGTQGVDQVFYPGRVFAFVRADEWHKLGSNHIWNGPWMLQSAFEGIVNINIQTCAGQLDAPYNFPVNGDVMELGVALPEKPLQEWLDMYCNLIAGVWTVDEATHTITIKTYKELINDAYSDTDHHLSLENENVVNIDSVTRYVDGFAQNNYTKTQDETYIRNLQCYNDYLSESKDLSEIEVDAGNLEMTATPDVNIVSVNDVYNNEDGRRTYDGKLTVFFENTATTDGARHIMDTLSMGVGEDVQQLVSNGSSVVVKVRMPYFRYANINHLTCASLHGRNFVVQKAKWDKGVAQLDMLDVGEVLPQMSYNWLNFEMPNGGDITLNRTGSPTSVVLEYSLDNGSTWTEWQEVGGVRTLTLAAGGRVWIRNQSSVSTGFSNSGSNYYYFDFTDAVNAYGDTRALLCSLPANGVISDYCFFRLFSFCLSLVTAPELPATTLSEWCYAGMFYGCSSLMTAPELPATTLADNCYREMFSYCTSLATAPELPATTLAQGCYYGMFMDCTSLVTAPDLPATTLAGNCYYEMFYNCTGINEVTMLATDISASNCLNNWLDNVAASGTLHLDSRLTGIPRDSASGIPTGWNRVDVDPWLNFEMPNGGDITLTAYGSPNVVVLEYSTDAGATWQEWTESGGVRTLTLAAGGRVWLRNQSGTSVQFGTSTSDYYRFAFTDNVNAYGDTRSLLCKTASDGVITNYCFLRLFNSCTTLLKAPRLDATSIAQYCYAYMFIGCTSIVVAPDLPSTSTYSNCYNSMFYNCSLLTVAPVLPALTIWGSSYRRMFYGCSSLNLVVLHATTASATNCTYQWLNGVAASGDLYCPSGLVFTSTDGGVPSGWTRHNI